MSRTRQRRKTPLAIEVASDRMVYVLTEGFTMTAGTLKIAGRKFRVIPEEDYQAMRTALRQQQRQAAEDRADVAQALWRLNDPKEKRMAWSHVKKLAGLA